MAGVLDLFSEPQISVFNFFVDLKVQSTHCDKQQPVWIFTKFSMLKNGLIENDLVISERN